MKNVNEIRLFFRQLINEAKDVISKGTTDVGGILGKVIGMIQPGKEAIEDALEFGKELGVSTNQDMDNSDVATEGGLSNFNEEAQRDIDAIEKGVIAGFRMNARARREGKEEGRAEGIILGRAQLFDEMKAAGVDMNALGISVEKQ